MHGMREMTAPGVALTIAAGTALAAFAACTPGGSVFVVAPVMDADAGPHPATSALAAAGPAPSSNKTCEATLRVGVVVPTPPTCWLDQKVAHKTAVLRYPCDGGPASAPFAIPFEGLIDDGGSVDLVARTTYRWSGDGCNWESTQRIRGVLAEGELTYTYEEQPIEGTGCSPAYCKARTAVAVQLR